MRGFISGLIWGIVAMGLMVAVVSLIAPLAPRPDVASDMPAPVVTQPATPPAKVNTPGPDADLVSTPPAAPEVSETEGAGGADGVTGDPTISAELPQIAPAPDQPIAGLGVSGAPEMATPADTPADSPDAPQAPVQVAEPESPAQAPTVERATAPEVPQVASAPVLAPEPQAEQEKPADLKADAPVMAQLPGGVSVPESETAPQLSQDSGTVPAEVPAPAAAELANPDGTPPQIASSSAAPPDTQAAVLPERPQEADAEPDVSRAPAAPPAQDAASVAEPDPAPETAAAPQTNARRTAEEAAPSASRDLPVIEVNPTPENVAPESTPDPRIAALPQAGEGAGTLVPRIGQPVTPLTERTTRPEDAPATEPAEQSKDDLPAITRYAAPLENPEGKPLMSIVLIDDPRAIGIEALREFPYTLTFAVDPLDPDAASRMARHRANGFEVVALVDLPEAATAQDVEVALSAGMAIIPETVALLEGQTTGFQGNRAQSDQVSAFAQATGRGLITQGNGLNTVQKLALRNGVAALPVFRDFDGAGQSPSVMRRFLDQAAFRARQEGGVIMLGRVRPDTISALLLWGLQDRANRVALAPVSAVLQKAAETAR